MLCQLYDPNASGIISVSVEDWFQIASEPSISSEGLGEG